MIRINSIKILCPKNTLKERDYAEEEWKLFLNYWGKKILSERKNIREWLNKRFYRERERENKFHIIGNFSCKIYSKETEIRLFQCKVVKVATNEVTKCARFQFTLNFYQASNCLETDKHAHRSMHSVAWPYVRSWTSAFLSKLYIYIPCLYF